MTPKHLRYGKIKNISTNLHLHERIGNHQCNMYIQLHINKLMFYKNNNLYITITDGDYLHKNVMLMGLYEIFLLILRFLHNLKFKFEPHIKNRHIIPHNTYKYQSQNLNLQVQFALFYI
jgi:hypothetical protein